jgi:hypothetical protein
MHFLTNLAIPVMRMHGVVIDAARAATRRVLTVSSTLAYSDDTHDRR